VPGAAGAGHVKPAQAKITSLDDPASMTRRV